MANTTYRLEQTGPQVQDILNAVPQHTEQIGELESGKVDKVDGKGLSQNDFTDSEKSKLDSLPTGTELTQELSGKQDTLTFDNVPTAGSDNPVKSSGIKTALDGKQNTLTFDNVPTAGSDNPVKSSGIKQAIDQVAGGVSDIDNLIPAQASAQNQLADKAFVNSSIATAAATFKGTFNSLAELQAVTGANQNDYGYVVSTDSAGNTVYARYKYVEGTGWVFEYNLNNSSFTAAEWAAIQSGITQLLVTKLSALPTNADLQASLNGKQATLTFDTTPTANSTNPVQSGGIKTALDGKQNTLTFDNVPTAGSDNPVKSSGIKSAIEANSTDIDAIEEKIPAAASAQNQLADKSFVNSSIATNTADFKGTYNSLEDLQEVPANANDYAYVVSTDASGNTLYNRYKYVDGTGWTFEYALNNSSFTAAQWAAIQSGITAALVAKLGLLPTNAELVAALAAKQNVLTFDTEPTTNSTNPVQSGGVKTSIDAEALIRAQQVAALQTLVNGKQNALTFDNTPTPGSGNPVTSGGVAAAIAESQQIQFIEVETLPSPSASTLGKIYLIAQGGGTYSWFVTIYDTSVDPAVYVWRQVNTSSVDLSGYYTSAQVDQLLNGKQDTLTFDNAPVENSDNPVKSGGIFTSLAGKQDALTFDNAPTENSDNPVKSGGIYTALGQKMSTNDYKSKGAANKGVYFDTNGAAQPMTYELNKDVVADLVVNNITTLTHAQVDALKPGYIIIKVTGNMKHLYVVTYKDETAGGCCLTYHDAENVETVAYEKHNDEWAYLDTTITNIGNMQAKLTFDNVPVNGSSNPVKSGGIYSAIGDEETRAKAAEKQNADDIDAIEAKIPSAASSSNQLADKAYVDGEIDNIEELIPAAASSSNQLADKAFVNSSIATSTADFKGTFNSLADLQQVTANANDYAYVVTTDTAGNTVYNRYKYVEGTGWLFEYALNNSSFTAAEWAAIQSGITSALVSKLTALPTNSELTNSLSGKVDKVSGKQLSEEDFTSTLKGKLDALPTNTDLQTALNGKQATLTFDNSPVQNSDNPVKSGGIYTALGGKQATIDDGAKIGLGIGTCTTSAATAAKEVTITDFLLLKNMPVSVRFQYGISVNGATLNISSTGAKPILIDGVALPAGVVKANTTATMFYDGTNWNIISLTTGVSADDEILVDLGLPSGLLWATRNLDVTQANGFAASPYQYECSFFSWGNTDGHNPVSNNSFGEWSFGSANTSEPYVSSPGAALTASFGLSFDAAFANLGNQWRMPTTEEFAELFANIDYINPDGTVIETTQANKLVTVNGVTGILLKSKNNSRKLFFPCSGFGNGQSWGGRGSRGGCWSSSLYSATNGRHLYFFSGGVDPQGSNFRFFGFSVRPVLLSPAQ